MLTKVVICGSFHRNQKDLIRIFKELESTGCRILSPISLDFLDTKENIVKAKFEEKLSIEELEKFHIRAMCDAKMIWLHAPSGYVGLSTSYEIGYASALKIPIFCYEYPNDEMLATRVMKVNSVFEAKEIISFLPGAQVL